MNAAVTAARPEELKCFLRGCEDPKIDGWAYEIQAKKCKPTLNTDICLLTILTTRCSTYALLQTDQHVRNEVSQWSWIQLLQREGSQEIGEDVCSQDLRYSSRCNYFA